jgi:hypothetical protein
VPALHCTASLKLVSARAETGHRSPLSVRQNPPSPRSLIRFRSAARAHAHRIQKFRSFCLLPLARKSHRQKKKKQRCLPPCMQGRGGLALPCPAVLLPMVTSVSSANTLLVAFGVAGRSVASGRSPARAQPTNQRLVVGERRGRDR